MFFTDHEEKDTNLGVVDVPYNDPGDSGDSPAAACQTDGAETFTGHTSG